jgi:hypothetical protein
MEQSMRAHLLAVSVAGSILVLGGAAADAAAAGSMATVPEAPIGHLQPHAKDFSPRSAAEQAEQGRLSSFDARQEKLDQELDKRLNICRC